MLSLHHLEQVADRARQAIEPYDHEGAVSADIALELRQGGACRDAPDPCSSTIVTKAACSSISCLRRLLVGEQLSVCLLRSELECS